MQDINTPLRRAYYALLAGNIIIDGVAVPVRYGMLAQGEQKSNYIIIQKVQSTGFDGDTTNFTTTRITFLIVTKAEKNNSGANADLIAGYLYQLVYTNPQPQEVLLMSGGQVINTKMVYDDVIVGLTDGERVVLNRIIVLEHIIQVANVSRPTNIFYGTQDDTSDPIDFSNTYLGNPDNPITINYGGVPDPKVFWVAYPKTSQIKDNWQDLNNDLNGGTIGDDTSAFEVRSINIMGTNCWLIINRYVTGFTGDPVEIKFS